MAIDTLLERLALQDVFEIDLADLGAFAFDRDGPRLAEIAEVAWSPAKRRAWDEFKGRLAAHAPRWTALGVNFYRSPQVEWER